MGRNGDSESGRADASHGVGHAERKVEVLRVLRDRGPLTTSRLAAACGISVSNCHNVLRRLRKDRAVETESGEFRPGKGRAEDEHDITDRGHRTLRYHRGE